MVVATVVGAVIGTALWLVFGLLAGRGHGWARIVVTVLGGLAVLSSLASLGDGSLLSLTAPLRVALCAALVVLLFRPEANRWYADVKAARRQPVAPGTAVLLTSSRPPPDHPVPPPRGSPPGRRACDRLVPLVPSRPAARPGGPP